MRRMWKNDDGAVTIEAALGSAALILLTCALIAGLATMAAHIAAVHVAHTTARALAVGDTPPTTPGIRTRTDIHGDWVTVYATASAPAPFPDQVATAHFPQENLP
ncbi:hypothetical protein C1Y63_02335 [Corynebacterium sp. 13CS0277]|uniref:hypothetical protein n=1 Tax=Corynebacterium sp. 13CS0277 TaxID=2071994 RepID=UPI000D028498|nr:hypothetical protein [Corynebacterium sp. 13CS0277]PRQ12170.1 hypothetical protein C1Y63_02335 [Corynebacterium sp. 13CS0277]